LSCRRNAIQSGLFAKKQGLGWVQAQPWFAVRPPSPGKESEIETTVGLPLFLQKTLLICGILYAFLYSGTDIVAGFLTKGYRFDTQSANLLGGVGTRTRSFVLPINIIAGILLIAFASGVWVSVDRNWVLRVMACLLAANAIFTMAAVAFFPFHPNEPVNSPANKVNVILMATGVILFLLAVILGAVGSLNWFRYYSIGILLLFVLGAILSTFIYKLVSSGHSGTSVGIQERTMIYAEMIWLALLAIVLLQM
jgi:hypothetical protein